MLEHLTNFFNIDSVAKVMLLLVGFIGTCIGVFARRYLKGDKQYKSFYIYFFLLLGSIATMVSVDNLFLFFASWLLTNLLLVRLMVHKSSWKAARYSGLLAAKNYLIGGIFIVVAFLILRLTTGEVSIKAIIHAHGDPLWTSVALLFLLLGAMTQSAIWPFHRWLISSLNSPTPVSAIMHAGIINGGGFLLVRFSPLYLSNPNILTIVFVIGIVSAFIGTFWKLIQHDIKRMLACSTMGQMGFMLVQCGLGFFSAAIAHLVTHGIFKAFLFLSTGGAAREKREVTFHVNKISTIFCSFMCGLIGSYCFTIVSGKSFFVFDSTLVLIVVAFVTTSQSALSILEIKSIYRLLLALITASLVGLFYGASIALISQFMPSYLMSPQAINPFHIIGVVILLVSWLSMLFLNNGMLAKSSKPWVLKGYVRLLNASQPHPETVTTHRNRYKYL